VDQAALAVEKNTQRMRRRFFEGYIAPCFQLHAQSGHRLRGFDGGLQAIRRFPFGGDDACRPEKRVVACSEFTGHARHGPRGERRAAIDLESRADLRLRARGDLRTAESKPAEPAERGVLAELLLEAVEGSSA